LFAPRTRQGAAGLRASRANQDATGQVVEGIVRSGLGSRARQSPARQAEEGDAGLALQSAASQGNEEGATEQGTVDDHRDFLGG
jgi:hypothetical protein